MKNVQILQSQIAGCCGAQDVIGKGGLSWMRGIVADYLLTVHNCV